MLSEHVTNMYNIGDAVGLKSLEDHDKRLIFYSKWNEDAVAENLV